MSSAHRVASIWKISSPLLVLLVPTLALAHPGHGSTSGLAAGLAHPITGLDHLAAMIGVGLWAAQRGGRALWLVPLVFVLVMTVGGASGPLFGTLFMSLGRELPAAPHRAELAAALAKSIDAVAARGKSQIGQKTMLDVLYPLQAAVAAGKTAREVADAADAAADATKPLKAIRGRASFLGDRSIGHIDPGARSSALIVRAIAETLEHGA